LSAWLAPICVRPSVGQAIAALIALPVAAYGFVVAVSTFDWEFLVQKSGALIFWVAAFAVIHSLVESRGDRTWRPPSGGPITVLVAFLLVQWIVPRLGAAADPRLTPDFIADAYAAVDPSFRIAREALLPGPPSDAADFYAYLRANSTLDDVPANAVDVTFHRAGARAKRPPPHIFLFIVDSLRRDYLSAYNPGVSFTPAIQAFSGESFVFRRAFSRYGGTGLAVPSIWAGAMLLHKQYVTPFAATNALQKLLDSNGYRRLITEDHISDELFSASDDAVGLDHDVPEMLHTFCRSLAELQRDLGSLDPEGRPVFAMTRPLDLHIGNIASARTPPGESYPGFYGPYAARVKRIDACFGEFIDVLKARGWYDDSIIVLTSDHGDSLGEGQRWGHGFTVFPEVMRIPLLVHLPRADRGDVATDLGRLTFSIDITPTLFSLVEGGVSEPAHRDLVGSPLFAPRAHGLGALEDRRRGQYLVASSYGGVYGLLSENGRRLYIADGIEGREYAYDLPPGGSDRRTGLTDAERDVSRRIIRDRVHDIAAWYGLTLGH
jgi:hypothetical protein